MLCYHLSHVWSLHILDVDGYRYFSAWKAYEPRGCLGLRRGHMFDGYDIIHFLTTMADGVGFGSWLLPQGGEAHVQSMETVRSHSACSSDANHTPVDGSQSPTLHRSLLQQSIGKKLRHLRENIQLFNILDTIKTVIKYDDYCGLPFALIYAFMGFSKRSLC